MYTVLFISSCISFHSTKIWRGSGTDTDADTYLSTTIYAAISFIVYWLFLVVIPLAHLIHESVKDKLRGEIQESIIKLLVCSTFPLVSIYLDGVFEDVGCMWGCICLVGSLLSLVMCYVDPIDYGLSYAFLGLWMGIFVHIEHRIAKLVMLIVVGVSFFVSQLWKDEMPKSLGSASTC